MRKYLTVYKMGLAGAFEYRASFFFAFIGSVIPLLGMSFLWVRVYAGGNTIAGFTLSQLLTYTVVSRIVFSLVATGIEFEVADEIRNGQLAKYLMRPYSYFGHWLATVAARKSVYLLATILPIGVLAFISRTYPSAPSVSSLLAFIASVFLALLLSLTFSFILGISALWVVESTSLFFLADVAANFLGGAFVPFEVFPASVQRLMHLLPFKYLAYIPLSMYLGRLQSAAALWALAGEAAWVAGLMLMSSYLWRRGLRRYTVEGG